MKNTIEKALQKQAAQKQTDPKNNSPEPEVNEVPELNQKVDLAKKEGSEPSGIKQKEALYQRQVNESKLMKSIER